MDLKSQQTFDPLIQNFLLPACVKKAHKGSKNICFDDRIIFPFELLFTKTRLGGCGFSDTSVVCRYWAATLEECVAAGAKAGAELAQS